MGWGEGQGGPGAGGRGSEVGLQKGLMGHSFFRMIGVRLVHLWGIVRGLKIGSVLGE